MCKDSITSADANQTNVDPAVAGSSSTDVKSAEANLSIHTCLSTKPKLKRMQGSLDRPTADKLSPSLQLTAYAGTGKDTLVADMIAGRLSFSDDGTESKTVKWYVYGPAWLTPENLQPLRIAFNPKNSGRVRRYAFADNLKNTTHEWLGFTGCSANSFERVKNTMLVKTPDEASYKVIRQHYIEYGQKMRKVDSNFWVSPIVNQIQKDKFADSENSLIDVVTDFRFDNENMPRSFGDNTRLAVALPPEKPDILRSGTPCVHPITIRLFRKEVVPAPKLADRTVDSEHNLDDLLTNYLLTPPDQFQDAIAAFPQYSYYALQGIICCD